MNKRLRIWLAALAVLALLFYGGVGWLETSSMIGNNPRWRGMNRGPADFGLSGETVSFPSPDGIPLKAWWLPAAPASRGTVIVAHGIDHTRQVMLPRAVFLVQGGYDVLALDLRGHGESGGTVVSPGLLESRDIFGAVRYVRSCGNNRPIAVLGVSYGAAATLIAAADSSEINAVVADGAFLSGRDVFEDINHHYLHDAGMKLWMRALFLGASCPGLIPATSLVYRLRTGIGLGPDLVTVMPAVRRIGIPVLLITGERDWIAPTAKTRQILAALPGHRNSLAIIPGALHDTTYSAAPEVYSGAVLKFLADNVR